MKINDYYYYKKNVIAKYMMSKVLSGHRAAIKKEKAKSINDFVFPLLSAVVSLYIAYFSKDYGLVTVLIVIASYIVFYYVIVKLFLYLIDKIKYCYRSYWVKATKVDIIELSNDFNNDVINQIYLSYSLLSYEQENSDLNLKKYYLYESLFNLEQALDSINDIFNEETIDEFIKTGFTYIHFYRIKVVFDMLKTIYTKLESEKNDEIETELVNIWTSYNNLTKLLSIS